MEGWRLGLMRGFHLRLTSLSPTGNRTKAVALSYVCQLSLLFAPQFHSDVVLTVLFKSMSSRPTCGSLHRTVSVLIKETLKIHSNPFNWNNRNDSYSEKCFWSDMNTVAFLYSWSEKLKIHFTITKKYIYYTWSCLVMWFLHCSRSVPGHQDLCLYQLNLFFSFHWHTAKGYATSELLTVCG